MPMFDFTCEICGTTGREWRQDKPPRFCSRNCRSKGKQKTRIGKWNISPFASEQIKKTYQRETGNGEIAALSQKLGLPRWKISRHAISQGWVAKKRKEPEWTERELTILQRSAHLSPERIQVHLRKAGFARSVTGIVLKRKRMRMLKNIEGHSARDVAMCFGVESHVVTRWIRLGYLKARRRGTDRVKAQGGDHWFIKEKWMQEFVLNCLDEVDLRKVDKYWFVDLVAGADSTERTRGAKL